MSESTTSRAVLTLATGRPVYFQMAVNLARSFLYWHRESDIGMILVTDHDTALPGDIAGSRVELRRVPRGSLGSGFAGKLRLDEITTADRTLFLDSDCLCAGSLEPFFERMRGRGFTVIGREETEGEFFGDVPSICSRFGLKALPTFVGALYYFERGESSAAIFSAARSLEPEYDAIGLRRLRGVPNEEPLLAIAMAMRGETPIPDDGSIKADAMHFGDYPHLDVLSGRVELARRVHAPRELPAFARPIVVHFNASFAEEVAYLRESSRLELVYRYGWPQWVATAHARLVRTGPAAMAGYLRGLLRPIYRRLFGTRPVRIGPRQ